MVTRSYSSHPFLCALAETDEQISLLNRFLQSTSSTYSFQSWFLTVVQECPKETAACSHKEKIHTLMIHCPMSYTQQVGNTMLTGSWRFCFIEFTNNRPCLQCKLPCMFTNNNKDQSEWRILGYTVYNNHPYPQALPSELDDYSQAALALFSGPRPASRCLILQAT